MLLKAKSSQAEFMLETLERATESERTDLPVWLTTRVKWSNGSVKHDVTDACLTEQEAIEIRKWVRSLEIAKTDSILGFTEPALHFIHLFAPDVIIVSLWLELVPPTDHESPKLLIFSRSCVELQ